MRQSPSQDAEALSTGDRDTLDCAFPVVYNELQRLAGSYLHGERVDHTLQPTALVHEVYLRLVGQRNIDWRNRAQFLAAAAMMMRRILVNYAEERGAQKRGGDATYVALDDTVEFLRECDVDVLALNDALLALTAIEPRGARIVELRFFGGLSIEETAEVLGISPATVKREWSVARAWLRRELSAA